MPANKNALLRYKTIDRCLRNRSREWTLEDLIEACSDALYEYSGKDDYVSRRTIQTDIQRAAPPDEFETHHVRLAVGAVIVRKPLGRRQKSRFLIVADGFRRMPGQPGQFTDSHSEAPEREAWNLCRK